METKHVYDLITSVVTFPNGMEGEWSRCFCMVCGDGNHSKGPRAGWKFEGDMVFYNCFNCGVKGNFDPHRDYPVSTQMWDIFKAYGIGNREVASLIPKKDGETESKRPERKVIPLTYIDTPTHFYPLRDASLSDNVALAARKALWNNYRLTQDDYPFYLSTGDTTGSVADKRAHIRLLGKRIIIPFFKSGKMIYYQSRALFEDDTAPKYVNAEIPKSNVLFNMDALYKNINSPLFIFEGAFDAIHVDGVATMENNASTSQIELLTRSPRTKVVVPDRKSDSRKLTDIALENGWGVSLPDIGQSSKDISEGICKYGKLHVLHSMVKNTYFGREAKMRSAAIGKEK